MRVLIIGGTKFIGPRVARNLVADDHKVSVFHRGVHKSALLPGVVNEIVMPVAAKPVRRVPDELRAIEPEIVVHMIAMGEEDSAAAVLAFSGVARRIVVLSSGDVYKAYGIFAGTEGGALVPTPMDENAPLRQNLYPYRRRDTAPDMLEHYYDKLLVERAFRSDPALPATVLRLPKVYGPEENADLATVYGYSHHPDWRWTHGFVENVAAAVSLAVTDDRAAGQTYNVGERSTPSVAERLSYLPVKSDPPLLGGGVNFDQDIVYDTTKIRRDLGYEDVADERDAMRITACS